MEMFRRSLHYACYVANCAHQTGRLAAGNSNFCCVSFMYSCTCKMLALFPFLFPFPFGGVCIRNGDCLCMSVYASNVVCAIDSAHFFSRESGCQTHAKACGAGIGVFLLIRVCYTPATCTLAASCLIY